MTSWNRLDSLEQGSQRGNIALADRRQVSLVKGTDRAIDCSNELQSTVGDLRTHHSAVGPLARPADQPPELEAIEEPGNVRVASNETLSNFAAGETFRRCATEGIERTVLRERQLERLESRTHALRNRVRESQDPQKDMLLTCLHRSVPRTTYYWPNIRSKRLLVKTGIAGGARRYRKRTNTDQLASTIARVSVARVCALSALP
jgi:hypothetical protein